MVKYNGMAYSLLPEVPRRTRHLVNKRRSKRKNLKIFGALVTAGFIFFIFCLIGVAITFGFFARDLPSPDHLQDRTTSQTTKIFDRNGKLLYNVFDDENRTLVTLDKIPKTLRNATISTEDKNFYKNQGFDVSGILRSARNLVVEHKIMGGGSTITQQLVKNTLLTNEVSLVRKIKELILSVQIERRYTKDQILQMYLNEIPYGGTTWGAQAAANQYFGKDVSQLSLTESAILAGLPQSPSVYSPFGSNPTAYINRTKDVLRLMHENGYITKAQEEASVKELPTIKFASFGQGIKAPHFAIWIKELLTKQFGEQKVLEGGLQVTTSLDLDTQTMIEGILRDQIESATNKRLKVSNGAVVVEDTKTGQILAMAGSKDYFATDITGNFNVATQGIRQPGSSLKPFNYLTGFEKGYTPATMWLDYKTDFGSNYTPGNYDDKEHGPLEVRYALANSYNIPAVKQLAVNGLDSMLGTLKDFGITTLNNPDQYGLSLTLGGGAIKLYELTNAYAILGNAGKSVEVSPILKVADSKGKVLFEYKPKTPEQVAPVEDVWLINHILSDKTAKYAAYGQTWAERLNFQPNIGVKTGTSENKTDNWTFGYTPSYTVGVWVGNNDNTPMDPRLASGITGAAPIYHDIMVNILKGKPVDNFQKPDNVISMEVDATTGQKVTEGTSAKRVEYFAKNNLPPEADMYVKVRICRPSGLLASQACEDAGQAEDHYYLVMYDAYTKQFQGGKTYCNPCPPTQTDTTYYGPTPGVNKPTVTLNVDNWNSAGRKLTMQATVTGTPNDVVQVDFTINTLPIGQSKTDPTNPYKATFDVPFNGTYTVTAHAIDSAGNFGDTSLVVNVPPS